MTKYRIYNESGNPDGGYYEVTDFSLVPEGAVEGVDYIVILDEGPTPEELYSAKVSFESDLYQNRILAGKDQHCTILGRLRAALLLNRITPLEHTTRLNYYEIIKGYLLAGQQNVALDKMAQLGYDDIGEDYYNEIFNMISSYVDYSFNSTSARTSDIGGGGIKNPK